MALDISRCSGKDIVMIQDVQQHTTTKNRMFDLVLTNQVVVWIGHIERGPMGFNGHHGFYIRQEDGSVKNWASALDSPYIDHEDMVWTTESSSTFHKGVAITWCVQPIHGNAVFVLFTKTYKVPPSVQISHNHDFVDVTLEVTNPYLSNFDRIPCTCFKVDFLNELMRLGSGMSETGTAYLPIALTAADWLAGRTFGIGTDKQLDTMVTLMFNKQNKFKILAENNIDVYKKLQVFTIAYARRIETERLYNVARLGVSQAGAIQASTQWRNLNGADASFDRFGCRACGACACLCCGILPIKFFEAVVAGIRSCIEPKINITRESLPDSVIPALFNDSVALEANLDVLDMETGVYKYGVLVYEKRAHTQTPKPDRMRLGPNGSVASTGPNGLTQGYTADLFTPMKKKESLHMYGPNLVPWHCNQNSVGGAIGMTNAILTEVKLLDDSYISVEQSAIRGNTLMNKAFFEVDPRYMIYVENEARLAWAQAHEKSGLYYPILSKMLVKGEMPYSGPMKIKCKNNEMLLKDKERVIIACDPQLTAYYGAEASALNSLLKKRFSLEEFQSPSIRVGDIEGRFVWGSGTTPEDRGNWYDLSMAIPSNSFSITVCGDDVAAVVNIDGLVFGVESDASNWDHSQVALEMDGELVGSLMVQQHYYRQFGCTLAFCEALLGDGRLEWSPGLKSKERIRINLGYHRRCSGLPDTTDGNTLVMAHLMSNILGETISTYDGSEVRSHIKDSIETLGTEYGVKLKVKVHDDPRRMTFLKGFYVAARIGGKSHTVWYPSPEILVKVGTSHENPSNNVMYAKLQRKNPNIEQLAYRLRVYDIIHSWSTFKGMPVLGSYLEMVKCPLKTSQEETRARLYDYDKWDKPELSSKVTHQDWNPMLEVLDIKEDVSSFAELCSKVVWEPGVFIVHPLIKKLAERYK